MSISKSSRPTNIATACCRSSRGIFTRRGSFPLRWPPRYTRAHRRRSMSDMRLIVAGAGGRMGRTLFKAIAATDGCARRRGRCAGLGRRSGTMPASSPGLGANGVKLTTDVAPLLASADGLLDFTVPAATVDLRRARRQGRHRACHRHHRAFRRGRRMIAEAAKARDHREVRQHEPRRQPARRAGQAGGGDARRGLRYRDRRDAPQQEDRRAVRHRADARPRRRGRPRHRPRRALEARARRPHRRAQAATSALRRCAAAPWSATIT